jgi:tripartite-type tricarboxylate transporter receptor subunit TctC
MLVSAKTPRDIVNKLNQSTLKALQDNEVKDRLVSIGSEAMPMSPEQFDQLIKDELISNAAVIKAAGIKSE